MSEIEGTKEGLSRRFLLKSVPMIAGMVVSLGSAAMPDASFAQAKLTHEQAKYQDTPKNGQQCSTCVNFVPPAACKIVANPINPQGWCQYYAKKTAG